MIEKTSDGVLLRPAAPFLRAMPEEVSAPLPHHGPARTPEAMAAGMLAEARRHHAGD